jgi:hypothetical protein
LNPRLPLGPSSKLSKKRIGAIPGDGRGGGTLTQALNSARADIAQPHVRSFRGARQNHANAREAATVGCNGKLIGLFDS